MTFDLEAARAGIAHYRIENPSNVDTESALKELVDQANLAEDALAEIERLRAENLELQGEVFGPDGIRANQACIIADQAASISELEIEITGLKADLEQSERVIDQQAARIKSLKKEIRRLKHESKVEVKFTNSYIKRLHDAEARIKELEAQCEDLMQNCNSLRERAWKAEVRIKEQDDALVEERTGTIRCESYDHCEGMYRIDLPDAMIRAQQELQAEGKIGLDAAKPRSWQITEERVGLLEYCLETLLDAPDIEEIPSPGHSIEVLRAMLTEAGQ